MELGTVIAVVVVVCFVGFVVKKVLGKDNPSDSSGSRSKTSQKNRK